MADKTTAVQKESICKCGIPNCQGHRMENGKAILVNHPLAKKTKEGGHHGESSEQGSGQAE